MALTKSTEKHYFTLTYAVGTLGGHTRHKELVKSIAYTNKCIWCAPSAEELRLLTNVLHVPIVKLPFNIPFIGQFISTLINLFLNRRHINNSIYFAFSEFDIAAAIILRRIIKPHAIYFLQRSDLIAKSEYILTKQQSIYLKLRIAFLKMLYKLTIGKVDKVIVQTQSHKEKLSKAFDYKHIAVVTNNVNTSWIKPKAHKSLPFKKRQNAVVFGVVANLFYFLKGFDLLLDALELIDKTYNFELLIIGAGKDEALIRNEIAQRKLDSKVQLLGKIVPASDYLNNFDAIVAPTPIDDCPNVILEVLAAGTPLIASDIPAHRHILGKKFSCVPLDAEHFSTAMSQFISTPKQNVYIEQRKLYPELISKHTFNWSERIVDAFAN